MTRIYLEVRIGEVDSVFSAATSTTTSAATSAFAQTFVDDVFHLAESLLDDSISSSSTLIVGGRTFVRSEDLDGRETRDTILLSK